MSAVELATAYIALVPSMKGAKEKISSDLSPAAEGAGRDAGTGLGRSIVATAAAWAAPLAAAVGIGSILKTGFDEAKDAAAGTAQLAAGIQSTGNAANVSVDGLNNLASSIQGYSGQTDDSIVKSEQLLLTFTNIKNNGPDKIFDLATKASADMAAKMGGDASSQAVLLGKALNDPVKGITALTRVGVSFTDAQKATIASMVKTGDVAGAQKVILGELNTEFGGAAAAAGQTFPGQMERAHRAFEDLSQGIVQGFLPVMGPSIEGVIKLMQAITPAIGGVAQSVADKAGLINGAIGAVFSLFKTGDFNGGIGKALGVEEDSPVVGIILGIRDGVIGAFKSIKTALAGVDLSAVWDGIKSAAAPLGAIFAQLGPALGPLLPQIISLATAFSPFQIILKAVGPLLPQLVGMFGQLATVLSQTIVGALTTLVPLFVQLSGVVSQTLSGVLAALLPIIVQLVTQLGQTLSTLLPVLMPIIGTILQLAASLIGQLAPIITQLITAILPPVVQIFGLVLGAITPLVAMLGAILIPVIQMLMPVVVTVFSAISSVIQSVMQIVLGVIQVVTGIISGNWGQVWGGILNIFGGIWNTIVSVLSGVLAIIWSVISSAFNTVSGFIGGVLGGIGRFFSDTWSNIINGVGGFIGGFLDFFTSLPGRIMGALSGAAKWLVNIGKDIIGGLLDGLRNAGAAIGSFFLGLLPGWIVGPFKAALGIASPSKVFRGFGVNVGEGLMLGVGDKKSDIASTMDSLVSVPNLPAARAPLAGLPGSASYHAAASGSSHQIVINQVDDPIGTAHAVSRRLMALKV